MISYLFTVLFLKISYVLLLLENTVQKYFFDWKYVMMNTSCPLVITMEYYRNFHMLYKE